MSNEIEILILDLDGTLARTEHLHKGRRIPYDILKDSPSEFRTSPLLYRNELKWELNFLIEQGVQVIIITRSPSAYASTLLQILGVDFSECYPHSELLPTPASKIKHIAELYEVQNENVLYIGDSLSDEEAAKLAKCKFEYPFWKDKNLLEEDSLYTELINYHFSKIETESSNFKSDTLEFFRDSLESHAINFDRDSLQFVGVNSNYDGVQLFETPFISGDSFLPVINPRIVSRWDYENNNDALTSLFEIVRKIFEPWTLKPGDFNSRKEELLNLEISAFTPYMGTYIGETLWNQCKDWKGKSIGSGPEVKLHLIELPAVVISAFLEPQAILIPAPPSHFSESKPGEISRRLAQRIAQIRRTNVLDIFTKSEAGEFETENTSFIPAGEFYCMIDDQLTDGRTIEMCLDRLPQEVKKGISLIIWSYSASGRRWVVKQAQ
jgi:hypothetical protein